MTRPHPRRADAPTQRRVRAADPAAELTDRLVALLEQGVKPWQRPWLATGGHDPATTALPLRACGTPYQGINVLILLIAIAEAGFRSRRFLTYRQAQAEGGQVRRGERGHTVFYWGKLIRGGAGEEGGTPAERPDADPDGSPRAILFQRAYTVFNAAQIDGLAAPETPEPAARPPADPAEPPHANFFRALGADIRHGSDRAYYAPASDHIQMPRLAQFRSPELYAATLAHECIHWTTGPGRLERDFGRKRWGDAGYAMEELVAELGACFLGAEFGFAPDHLDNHAAYLASWLKVLKSDKTAIFVAAAHAQRASTFLTRLARPDAPPTSADDAPPEWHPSQPDPRTSLTPAAIGECA